MIKEPAAPKITPAFGTFTTTDSNRNEAVQQIFSGHKPTMVKIWATFAAPACGKYLNWED